MDWKKWAITTVIAFVVIFTMSFVMHGVLLDPQYKAHAAANPGLARSEAAFMERMWVMAIGYLSFGAALTWIYAQGLSRAPWVGQAVRFGVAAWALVFVPWGLVDYTLYMIRKEIAVQAILADLVSMIVTALVVGAMYRAEAGSGRTTAAAA